MCFLFSLNLLLALCLAARGNEAPQQKEIEAKQNEDSLPQLIYPSHDLSFQRQPVVLARNNLNFFIPATTTTVTTTSTVTCTFSTAAQCIGRRRREITIEDRGAMIDETKQETEPEMTRNERKADPAFYMDPYFSYPQYHPQYVVEPSFERSSYFQLPRRFSPFAAQPAPDMARFLFGVGLTFTSTTTVTTTSSWRPVCAFPGTFQACLSF